MTTHYSIRDDHSLLITHHSPLTTHSSLITDLRGDRMSDNQEPVVLELAPLPREQLGPFLLLGLSKTADQEEIEANWAQRVIWARKKQYRIPLEDVNWARETINSSERRVKADLVSLNADTAERALEQRSEERRGGKEC